jgi:VWFA-related protein
MLLVCAACAAAQEPRFDARSRLVQVPVNVSDLKGRSIDGLSVADFLVLDEGRPRPATVDTIDTGVAPIALIVAVQTSGISRPAIEKTRRIGAMIRPLVTGERGCGGLIAFAERVTWLEKCTKDEDALTRAFTRLRPGEEKKGRMLDAVTAAVEHLRSIPNVRRVLLLISETRDRGSESALDPSVAGAQAAGVTVYAATYSAFKEAFTSKQPVSRPKESSKPQTPMDDATDNIGTLNGAPPNKYNPKIPPAAQRVDVLGGVGELARLKQANSVEVLSRETGGAMFPFTSQRALEAAIHKLGGELHNQYVLSFAPEPGATGYHRLEVRLTRPGEYRIRRPGYMEGTGGG